MGRILVKKKKQKYNLLLQNLGWPQTSAYRYVYQQREMSPSFLQLHCTIFLTNSSKQYGLNLTE
jgi:hypothetical protein